MDAVTAFFDFFQFLSDWFTGNSEGGGIFGWFEAATQWLIAELFMLWLKGKIWVLTTAWGAAKIILEQLGVNGMLSGVWNSFSEEIRLALMWFKIPEAVNLILNALVTKLVLRVVF